MRTYITGVLNDCMSNTTSPRLGLTDIQHYPKNSSILLARTQIKPFQIKGNE